MAARLPSYADLGYVKPSNEQILEAVKRIIEAEYDGQCFYINRRVNGNLHQQLRAVVGQEKVVVPDSLWLAKVIRPATQQDWCVYTEDDTFGFRCYVKPFDHHPNALW